MPKSDQTTMSLSRSQIEPIRRLSLATRYPYGVIARAAGELLEEIDPVDRDARLAAAAAASTPSPGDAAQHGNSASRKQPQTQNTHRTAPPNARRRRGAA